MPIVYADRGPHGDLEIFIRWPDGTVVNLTNHPSADAYPSFSLIHRRIVFASNRDGPTHIFSMNADGSDVRRLTDSPFGDTLPSWSPQGTQIAYQSLLEEGNWEIYVMHVDGSNKRNLTQNPAIDISPSWSPDGRRIAFETNRDGDFEIYVMNANGSQPTNLTQSPDSYDITPLWQEDGRIVFRSDRGQARGEYRSYIMNADGSDVALLP